jgi:hypothetical protein
MLVVVVVVVVVVDVVVGWCLAFRLKTKQKAELYFHFF